MGDCRELSELPEYRGLQLPPQLRQRQTSCAATLSTTHPREIPTLVPHRRSLATLAEFQLPKECETVLPQVGRIRETGSTIVLQATRSRHHAWRCRRRSTWGRRYGRWCLCRRRTYILARSSLSR